MLPLELVTDRPALVELVDSNFEFVNQLILGLLDESEDGVHEEREFAAVQLVLRLHECLVVGVLVLRDGAGQRQHGGHG